MLCACLYVTQEISGGKKNDKAKSKKAKVGNNIVYLSVYLTLCFYTQRNESFPFIIFQHSIKKNHLSSISLQTDWLVDQKSSRK